MEELAVGVAPTYQPHEQHLCSSSMTRKHWNIRQQQQAQAQAQAQAVVVQNLGPYRITRPEMFAIE